jgi:hypothetical protein
MRDPETAAQWEGVGKATWNFDGSVETREPASAALPTP